MNITEKQLELITHALRIADFWIEAQEPSDQLASDAQDVRLAYNAIDCVKRGNITTKMRYYKKTEAHGWKCINNNGIAAPEWSAYDRQAYRQMIEQGSTSLVLGWNRWELVQERAQ